MKQNIDCRWQGNMAFTSEVTGHTVTIDADSEVGGEDQGPRPKPLILTALGGCTGMDVVSILKKMQQNISYFNVHIAAESTEEHPKTYTAFHITYEFKKADNLDTKKVEKAVNLSQERYCGVSALLKQAAEMDYEISYI